MNESAKTGPVARFNTAFAKHRAGDLVDAAALYRQLLLEAPAHVDALHLLGLIEAQTGQHTAAIALIRKAVALQPTFAQAHYHLGNVHRQLGRNEEAIACYRQAVAIEPVRTAAWVNLGACARALGRSEEALQAYRQAIVLAPDNADVHYNLGCALHHDGQHEEAVAAYRRAATLRPAHADAHGNLGAALQALGRHREALVAYSRQAELAPASAQAHVTLSAALIACGGLASATRAARTAIALAPDDPSAWEQLGHALREDGQAVEAIEAYRRALALTPGGNTPAPAKAAPVLADSNLLVALAIAQQEAGQADAARASIAQALTSDPMSAAAWTVLGGLKHFIPQDPDIGLLESLVAQLRRRQTSIDDLINCEFTLGKALMEAGEADRAFAVLTEANRRHRARISYDVQRDIAVCDAMSSELDQARMAQLAGHGVRSDRPIFIVGMPRSGTTLVEQILATHPAIHGGGEMQHLDIVLNEHFGRCEAPEWNERLRRIDGPLLARLGRAYLDRTADLAPPSHKVTDKMPANFRHLGLIQLIFPDALIIHCRREPAATCLSCFATHFSQGQDFTYDLGELGAYYRVYARLMQHWRQIIPASRLIEINYEQLVADFEPQARRLIAACGLAWTDACLDFHRTRRSVRTASVNQVRQPIYNGSVARWKIYDSHLRALAL